MSVALNLYDNLRHAQNDDTRARLIAEAFESFEQRYPNLQETATRTELSETELRLIKEIKQVEGTLRKEIESVRLEIKEMEGALRKEIAQVEGALRKEIAQVELRLTQAMHRQTLWVIGSIGTLLALMRFLDHLA